MEIRKEFVDKNGILYPNISEVAYTSSNIFGNLGTLVNETNREINDNFKRSSMDLNDEGVYIYKSSFDPNIALRIYKCFYDPSFNGYQDEKLISKLQNFQERVKRTSFPLGVVTLDGKIIGQKIPYYETSSQLYQIKEEVTLKELLELYRKCLIILSELHSKGIAYIDIHAKNFLVDDSLNVQLIDFEPDLVKFDDKNALAKSLYNFYKMINLINERIGLNSYYIKPNSLEEAFTNLDKLEKKLK